MNKVREIFTRLAESALAYAGALIRWLFISLPIGLIAGLIGTAFHKSVEYVTDLRLEYHWLIFLLPVIGAGISLVYKALRVEGHDTNDVISQVNEGTGLHAALLPAVFVSTVVTHLGGGSAGREGAALQMGGTVGYTVAKLLRLDQREMRIFTMAGMAAFFSALFGTPVAAAVFVIAVASVGSFRHAAFLPCLSAALVAYVLSIGLGVEPTRFTVEIPQLSGLTVLGVIGLGVLSALVSVIFCETIHFVAHAFKKYIPSPLWRAALGGIVLIGMSLIASSGDYNGAGMNVIRDAVESGRAKPYAFAVKILFTAVTLGAGFKGGEVVPSFYVGATFGCFVGTLMGLPAGFAAALGLIGVFCGAVICPIASMFLFIEMFGSEGLVYAALICGLSYVLSGYSGIYSSQHIMYDKLRADLIDVHTNEKNTRIR